MLTDGKIFDRTDSSVELVVLTDGRARQKE